MSTLWKAKIVACALALVCLGLDNFGWAQSATAINKDQLGAAMGVPKQTTNGGNISDDYAYARLLYSLGMNPYAQGAGSTYGNQGSSTNRATAKDTVTIRDIVTDTYDVYKETEGSFLKRVWTAVRKGVAERAFSIALGQVGEQVDRIINGYLQRATRGIPGLGQAPKKNQNTQTSGPYQYQSQYLPRYCTQDSWKRLLPQQPTLEDILRAYSGTNP